jgi:transcriptional antiterminator
MKEEITRIIVMKNGLTVLDETDPNSVIMSIGKRESSKVVHQQIFLLGHPMDIFKANHELSEKVQQSVMEKVRQDLKEHPEDPTAKKLLRLLDILDMVTPKGPKDMSDEEEEKPNCDTCSFKDDCDELNKPSKGSA